jgi:foldase protein PrsA
MLFVAAKQKSKRSAKRKKTSKTKAEKVSGSNDKLTKVSSSKGAAKSSFLLNNRSLHSKKYWLLVFVLIVLGAGYLFRGLFIAATVNGTPISRFAVIKDLEKQGGKQTLDKLIIQQLVEQQAKNKNVLITDEELDAEVQAIRSRVEAQGQDFQELLTLQGLTEDVLKENIRSQLLLQKLLEDRIQISDEEVNSFMEENSDSFPEDLSEQEKIDLAKNQLSQDKLQSEIQAYLTELKDAANINYFVNY